MTARRKIGVGLLGAGVVGEAIQDDLLAGSQGIVGQDLELELRRIYTRNPKTKKWFKDRPELFTSQAIDVIDDPTVEIVIEALGFQEPGDLPIFRDYILRAFKKGKSVVTSDKAVLARYGAEIWAAAQQS
jgi:homoserine dehydrogenase